MGDWMRDPPKSASEQFELARHAIDRQEKPIEREPRPGMLGQFDKATTTSMPEKPQAPAEPTKTTLKTPLSFPTPERPYNMRTPLGNEVTAAHTAEAISKEAARAKDINETINKARGDAAKSVESLNERDKNRDDRSK